MALTGENKAFAVGHIALAYLSSKTSAVMLKTKLNVPLALTLSVIPDIDILFHMLFPGFQHRGPTHSLVATLVVFIPIFVVYRKDAVPYFFALIQHSLIGDYIAGGSIQLLWPLTTQVFGLAIKIDSPVNVTLEWTLFLASMVVMLKARDLGGFFQSRKSSLLLAIPAFTVLLPTMVYFPLGVPLSLMPPHLVLTILFLVAIAIELSTLLRFRRVRNASQH